MTDDRASQHDAPVDRLTRLCAAMTDALDAHPEGGPDVRCVVMLQAGELGGLQMHNYEDYSEGWADVFIHLAAIFEANGKKLLFAPMPGQG